MQKKLKKLLVLSLTLLFVGSLTSCGGKKGSDNEPDNNGGDEVVSEYETMDINTSRSKADGTKVNVSGQVGFITKKSGFKPNGFFLLDGTGSTYIYNPDLAATLTLGDKISINGTTAHYMSSKEASNADKYNYKGSIQLTDTTLVKKIEDTTTYDYSWIEETSIKNLLGRTNYSELTANVFKVTSYVTKSIGNDHVNYYFNDLDGRSGSYTYSMNNGHDFDYLDAYKDKVCEVYLSIINYKPTSTEINARFIPLKVTEIPNYKLPDDQVNEFVFGKYVKDEIKPIYNGDPNLVLPTKISEPTLGFNNVMISYESNDPNVIYVEEVNGKLYLKVKNEGKTTLKVTMTYGTHVSVENVEVAYNLIDLNDAITVLEAVNAKDGDKVMVRGIVASSLVNKDGFYLVDDTAVIAVQCPADQMSQFAIGNDVVLDCTRKITGQYDYRGHKQDVAGTDTIFLDKVVANLEGNHPYSEKSVVKDKTIADLVAMDVKEAHTTTIYEVECKAIKYDTGRALIYELVPVNGDEYLSLYSSNAETQCQMMEKYFNETITVQLVLCNFNAKKDYKCIVMSVITPDGREVNDLNFR